MQGDDKFSRPDSLPQFVLLPNRILSLTPFIWPFKRLPAHVLYVFVQIEYDYRISSIWLSLFLRYKIVLIDFVNC